MMSSLTPSTATGDVPRGTSQACTPATPSAERPTPPLSPRYRPLCLLGHGGMGSVEAVAEELPDGTSRVVARKSILRTPGTDAARLEMFLREAKLTTLLSHPNVIRSFEYGEAQGEVFLTMEYVAGEPLSRVISVARERGEKLPVPVLAYILAEACEGLHAAHELKGPDGESLGVVHRDVSPHNVMVGYDGTVKLLDFGVAKIDLIESAARTKTGEVKGKTAYMSPEQAMGEEVDRRSDLYSIGAVLFECLTGRRMWGEGTDFEVLRRLALEAPPTLAVEAPDAPASLASLHARLIERSRDLRPETAADVATELRSHARTTTSDVRAWMDRLFPGEREARAATLDHALHAGPETGAGTAAISGPPATAGESGPVFVTHRTQAVAATRRPLGLMLAAAATVALGVAGLAYARRAPVVDPSAGRPTEGPRSTPPALTPATAITAKPVDPAPPPVTEPASTAVVPLPPKANVRHVATPRVAPPPTASSTEAPASVIPTSSAAPVPPSPPVPTAQKSHKIPDVDPNPF